jgi:hypothetical protein
MTNLIRSNFQAHPFHLVSPSPWPLFTCISLLTLTTAGVFKLYSTNNYKPVKIYPNADTDKIQILKDNKGKSGISFGRSADEFLIKIEKLKKINKFTSDPPVIYDLGFISILM